MAEEAIDSVPADGNPAPADVADTVHEGDVSLGSDSVQPADPAPQNDQSPAEGAPEEYQDFVDDKGVAFSAKDMPEFTSMAKELGLSQDKAQKLLLTMVPTVKGKISSTLTSLRKQWQSAALSDKEYGGDAFKSNMQVANTAFAKYVTPELKQLMQQSGLSAHPDFIRMFYRIGKSMSQDTGITGQGSPQPKRRLFPNSNMAI